MRIRYTRKALAQLDQIFSYVEARDPRAAKADAKLASAFAFSGLRGACSLNASEQSCPDSELLDASRLTSVMPDAN